MGGQPGIEAGCDTFAVRRAQMLVDEEVYAGLQRRFAALQPRDPGALPDDPPVRVKRDGLVGSRDKRRGAVGKLRSEHLHRRMARGLPVNAVARRIGRKAKAVKASDIVILDKNLTVVADLGHHLLLIAQAPHEHAGAPVHETLCQALMKRV